MTRTSLRAAAIGLLLTSAACGSAPTRLGTASTPVSISSVYGVNGGGVGSDVLDALVASTQDQAVSVDRPLPSTERAEEEFDALDTVVAGDADLTVIRAGALAIRGASSLAVLQTPLLVISPAHADRVAADPVALDLMAGLDSLGLTGLALVPGGARHLFGYGRVRTSAEDFRGIGLNSNPAAGADALIEALGARPDHTIDDERRGRIATGDLGAMDSSLIQPGGVDRPAVVTSNVTLYTKFDVVVIRTAAWDGLTQEQQEALRKAAAEAGHVAVAARDDEDVALDRWCDTPSAASVVATPDEVASFVTALRPAIEAARADASTRDLVARVAELGVGTTPPAGKVCGSLEIGTTNEDFLVERVGDQRVFDGVWRIDAAYQDFIDAGVSTADARANAGVWTLTVKDHVAVVDQPHGSDCAWDFYVNGDRVSLDLLYDGNDACYGLAIGTWARDGDVVRFTWERERFYDVAIDNALFAGGMHLIG